MMIKSVIMGWATVSIFFASASDFQDVRFKWEAARTIARENPGSALPRYDETIRISPGNHRLLLSAAASALGAGDRAALGRWLELLAAVGGSVDAADIAELETALGQSAATASLVERLAANRSPVERSEIYRTVPPSAQLVEGVSFDPVSRSFFVSAVATPGIFIVREDRTIGPLPLPLGLGSPMGLAVDSGRRVLWAAIDVVDPTPGPSHARMGLLRLSLASFESQLIPGPEGREMHIGDIVLRSDGSVFASDSRSGAIYHCPPRCRTLRTVVRPGILRSAQGLAFSRDERRLYVSDYAYGILVIDTADWSVNRVETAPGIALDGIDGLVAHDGDLIAVQNGWAPARVTRIRLDRSGRRAISAEILDRSHPLFQEPTAGVIVRDSLIYVANSQWPSYGQGGLKEGRAQRPTHLLRLPLR